MTIQGVNCIPGNYTGIHNSKGAQPLSKTRPQQIPVDPAGPRGDATGPFFPPPCTAHRRIQAGRGLTHTYIALNGSGPTPTTNRERWPGLPPGGY